MLKQIAELAAVRFLAKIGLLKGVKISPPSGYSGSADRDSVKNSIAAIENLYDLMNVTNLNQSVRFTATLLIEKTRTCF